MRAESLSIAGVLKIEHQLWRDERGVFVETWNERAFRELGVASKFVQDNLSISRQWTVRGLHYQVQQPQGKLIRVLAGEIYDVLVDLRCNSPTFRRAIGVHLTAQSGDSLWVPEGLAHGFLALEEQTQVSYKVTDFWLPKSERTLLWNDPELRIDWPIPPGVQPIVSAKDAAGSSLENADVYP
jgi:dTDP-4-dehydrorhamnose 3,5-epimerase